MLTSASSRAQGVIGMTIPAYRWSTRAVISLTNFTLKLRGMRFRAFVHPPQPMIEMMKSAGFSVVYDQSRLVWRTIVFQRPPPAG
jgi:magnesium-protoporphyrin O-methyltransferase